MQLAAAMPWARVDLSELKSQLAKRLGPERARRYFSYLHQLLSNKLNKAEFHKLCFLTLGPENVPLHNKIIRSVIKNACQAKTPPQLRKSFRRQDVLKPTHALPPVCNVDIMLQSPRKRRSFTQRSKIGLNEKANIVVLRNGDLGYHDLGRRQGCQNVEQAAEQPVKRRRCNSNGIEEVLVGDDGEFMEQNNSLNLIRHPLLAPLGIPFCTASVGSVKRPLPPAGSTSIENFSSFMDNGELLNTEELQKKMERIVEVQGLGGVALDCVNLLNNGLDTYLKNLIKSSIELVRARVGCQTIKQPVQKQKANGNPMNGIWLDNSAHMHSVSGPLDLQERNCHLITLQDFTVAMKLNPQQLGEDAPLLLEKICLHSFENNRNSVK